MVSLPALRNAYKALPKFKQSSKFSTWFYRIVVNEALRRLKDRKMEKIDFVDDYGAGPATQDLILSLEARERKILINEALDRMPLFAVAPS